MIQSNEIHIIDGIYCKAGKGLVKPISACLQYKSESWHQRRYGAVKTPKTAYKIDRRSGRFLVGLLPRIERYLKRNKIKYKVVGELERIQPEKEPKVKGIKLRPDQKALIKKAISKQRGVIISPTGSGKTVLVMGIISAFPKANVLFLCHTLDLINQTVEELVNKGFKGIQVISGEERKKVISKKSRIVVSTIQSFSKLDPALYIDLFDITFVDECHHCINTKSQYGEAMTKNLSPMKIGVTATLPDSIPEKLDLEGLIGPVLGELTIEEGMELGIIAKPKVTLIPIQKSASLTDHTRYNKIYEHCIVKNRARNTAIVKETLNRIKKGKSVLVMVKEIEHGNRLVELGKKMKVKFEFVRGSTDTKTRASTKKAFNNKKVKAVISTAVWKEGINIPTLDCVINAAGGKSSVFTLQVPGRALRTHKDKTEVEIIDFADPYRFLSDHAISRIQIYLKKGWL